MVCFSCIYVLLLTDHMYMYAQFFIHISILKSAYNNREFTIFYYNSITLSASYGHVTFIASRSCKSCRSCLGRHLWCYCGHKMILRLKNVRTGVNISCIRGQLLNSMQHTNIEYVCQILESLFLVA